jgi:hypothetical protein
MCYNLYTHRGHEPASRSCYKIITYIANEDALNKKLKFLNYHKCIKIKLKIALIK